MLLGPSSLALPHRFAEENLPFTESSLLYPILATRDLEMNSSEKPSTGLETPEYHHLQLQKHDPTVQLPEYDCTANAPEVLVENDAPEVVRVGI